MALPSDTLAALARRAASSALQSARENGAAPGADETEAAERVDGDPLGDLLECADLGNLSHEDAREVSRMAVDMLVGYRRTAACSS